MKQFGKTGKGRGKLWPWVATLIVVICLIYSYERIVLYLNENREALPFMFLDFIIEYFLGAGESAPLTDV